MTIFTILQDILSKKSDLSLEVDFEDSIMSNFLLQKWISMTSSYNSFFLNETSNKFLYAFNDDKRMYYKFLLMSIDKSRYRKVEYIKKPVKTVNEKDEKAIKYLKEMYGISRKEVILYIEEMGIDLSNYYKYI